MKRIHLYDIDTAESVRKLTGANLNPAELASGKFPILKERFAGTEEHLKGYVGKWYIEAIRPFNNTPFDIIYFSHPRRWSNPAQVFLVLEDLD